jgi:hypothetical protein
MARTTFLDLIGEGKVKFVTKRILETLLGGYRITVNESCVPIYIHILQILLMNIIPLFCLIFSQTLESKIIAPILSCILSTLAQLSLQLLSFILNKKQIQKNPSLSHTSSYLHSEQTYIFKFLNLSSLHFLIPPKPSLPSLFYSTLLTALLSYLTTLYLQIFSTSSLLCTTYLLTMLVSYSLFLICPAEPTQYISNNEHIGNPHSTEYMRVHYVIIFFFLNILLGNNETENSDKWDSILREWFIGVLLLWLFGVLPSVWLSLVWGAEFVGMWGLGVTGRACDGRVMGGFAVGVACVGVLYALGRGSVQWVQVIGFVFSFGLSLNYMGGAGLSRERGSCEGKRGPREQGVGGGEREKEGFSGLYRIFNVLVVFVCGLVIGLCVCLQDLGDSKDVLKILASVLMIICAFILFVLSSTYKIYLWRLIPCPQRTSFDFKSNVFFKWSIVIFAMLYLFAANSSILIPF